MDENNQENEHDPVPAPLVGEGDSRPGDLPPAERQADTGAIALRLDIQGAETPLSVTLTGEAVIGRRDPDGDNVPDIDLTSFGGYRKGISRRHAVLYVQDNQLRLTDMGSYNGTFLNGHRVPARQTALVNDGDEIRVGQIVFYVRTLAGE